MSFSEYSPAAISSSPRIRAKRAPQLIGQFHGALQLSAGHDFDGNAGAPQLPRQFPGVPQSRIAQGRHEDIERRVVRPGSTVITSRSSPMENPIPGECTFDPSDSAKPSYRPPPSTEFCAPRFAVHHFERGAHVVVEAAHQSRLDLERNPAVRQISLHGVEVRPAGLAKVVENGRQLVDGRLILGDLAVQNAQRIRHRSSLTIFAQRGRDRFQSLAQPFDEQRPALVIAHRINQQREAGEPGRDSISTTISITSASTNGDSDPMASAPIWKNWR